uniref:Cytochrome c oxidase subunit 2 n=1 Tax=Mukaria splendida TaxID=2586309 RepID=A0A7L8ZUI9_9HEMI|nr:cytochrome c oxidase subunit II [Mukaria splendida]QOI73917.1 cytochrome c oxidase subunit II [Mukaria splendida]
MATWQMMSFQDPVTPIMEQLILFHDHTMMIIIMITTTVLYMLISMSIKKMNNRVFLESQMIELIWTLIPAVLLVIIAMPSLSILYMIEEINNPMITIKALGNQWYWKYEYSDFKKIEFESYMKKTNSMENKEYRLLETDNRTIIPMNFKSRILVTSNDVIHSWTIPSMGIKIDGTPGRINQGTIMVSRPGVYYGQCSEICGTNHSFMPITMESINIKKFLLWIKNF